MILGSNFLSASLFVRLCGLDNTHIYVMDRKDPTTIMNYNQDVYNIFKKYCKKLTYRDLYNDTEFGDPKRNIKITFLFNDWTKENIILNNYMDIIINTGSVYDTVYAEHNPKETLNVNINGMHNLLNRVDKIYNSLSDDKRKLFIQCSSINVYGDQTNKNEEEITEDSTVPNPKDLLNYSLYAQEQMLKSMFDPELDNIDYIILRLGTLVGEFTPRDSLVTAAVSAMLQGKKEFTVYNGNNSIELLDINDLGFLIEDIVSKYKQYQENDEKEIENYKKMVNQTYNIKSEEPQEKTVMSVARSIFMPIEHLPTITKEHKIKGINDFKIKAPKIVESFGTSSDKPNIKFDKSISGAKAKELLKFASMKPLVYSLLPITVNYLLNYILVDFSEAERKAFAKIFYLPQTPHPEITDEDEDLHKDIKKVVRDTKKYIEDSFENQEVKQEDDTPQ